MFTKILESSLYGQILLIKDYDLEDEMHTLRLCVKPEMSGLGLCEVILKFNSEDDIGFAFDSGTIEQAEVLVRDIFTAAEMLSGCEDE